MVDDQNRKIFGQTLIVSASAFAAQSAESEFALPWYWAGALGTAMAFALLVFIEKTHVLRRFKVFRRFFYREVFRKEGYWLTYFKDHDRPWSISKIYYSPKSPEWKCKGFAVDSNFHRVVEWKNRSIYLNEAREEWIFDGDWWDTGSDSSKYRNFVVYDVSHGVARRMSYSVIDHPRNQTRGVRSRGVISNGESRMIMNDVFEDIVSYIPKKVGDLYTMTPEQFIMLARKVFPELQIERM